MKHVAEKDLPPCNITKILNLLPNGIKDIEPLGKMYREDLTAMCFHEEVAWTKDDKHKI